MTPSRRTALQVLGAAGLGASGALTACTTPAGTGAAPTSAAPPTAVPGTTPPSAGETATAGEDATATASAAAKLRFLTASDGHLGEKGTDSRRYLKEFVRAANRFHAATRLDFAVINGDIGHGGVALLEEAKAGLDKLDMPYFVTQGNHDEVSADDWERVWGTPGNQVKRFGSRSILLANTSNEAGDYLCADRDWLSGALDGEADQQDVFVFMHITPNTWTKWGIPCPKVRALLADTPNLRAVFNGHDHDQSGVKVDDGVRYFFDAHYGGHWGTSYRAFRYVQVSGSRLKTRLVTTAGKRRKQVTLSW